MPTRPGYTLTHPRHLDGTGPADTEPNRFEKLLGYFPAEATALYAALAPLFTAHFDGTGDRTELTVALWFSFGAALALNWLTLLLVWHARTWQHLVLSAVAFTTYLASTGGPFARHDWYEPFWAAVAAILVTAFIVLVPAPKRPA